jgi:hypothetical protein
VSVLEMIMLRRQMLLVEIDRCCRHRSEWAMAGFDPYHNERGASGCADPATLRG